MKAKGENETYLNQRIGEDELVGDLENETDLNRNMRDKHFPKDFLDQVEVAGLNAKERKILTGH